MTIISDHSNEGGEIENILKLSDKDLKARKVEVCNPRFKTFVNRNVHCYSLWTSHLIRWRRSITNRRKTQPNGSQKRRKGVPLRRNGRYSQTNKEALFSSLITITMQKSQDPIMCCYKCVTIEFRYTGTS